MSLFHPGRDKHGKYAGVDGMADESVRTAHNQLMIFFQRNCPAPVASENRPGPETQAESAQAQDCGGNKDGIGLGNEVNIQRRPETVATQLRYERLLLPWKTQSDEILVTLSSTHIDADADLESLSEPSTSEVVSFGSRKSAKSA